MLLFDIPSDNSSSWKSLSGHSISTSCVMLVFVMAGSCHSDQVFS